MNAHSARTLTRVLLCGAVLAGMLVPALGFSTAATVSLVICLVLTGGGFFVLLKFCRCPHCKELLPLTGAFPKSCPSCGRQLAQDKKN